MKLKLNDQFFSTDTREARDGRTAARPTVTSKYDSLRIRSQNNRYVVEFEGKRTPFATFAEAAYFAEILSPGSFTEELEQ